MAGGTSRGFKGRRWYAALYGLLDRKNQRWMRGYLSYVVGDARGRVLEIGAGTGHSFECYEKARAVVATEPDPFMLAQARKRLEELGLANVELCRHAAEDLPYEDGSFDHVVSVLVLCTVKDARSALLEARRVLKPSGTLRFIEHVRYDGGARGLVQDAIAPVWRYLGGGCHVNRRTAEAVLEAGFQFVDLQRYVTGLRIPIVVGIARPA
jgi:ubiquinone/menaquinone biosynthesis C-methylase UbiE